VRRFTIAGHARTDKSKPEEAEEKEDVGCDTGSVSARQRMPVGTIAGTPMSSSIRIKLGLPAKKVFG